MRLTWGYCAGGLEDRIVKGLKIQAFPISPARQRTQGVGRAVRTSVVDSHQSESVARRGLSCYRRNSLRTTVVFSARIFADRVDSAASLKTA
jgi:hypothetical protein